MWNLKICQDAPITGEDDLVLYIDILSHCHLTRFFSIILGIRPRRLISRKHDDMLSFNEFFFYDFRETEARLLASAANCAQKSAGLCQDDTSSMMSLVGFCLLNGADKNTPATTTKTALGTIHILRNHFYGRGGS